MIAMRCSLNMSFHKFYLKTYYNNCCGILRFLYNAFRIKIFFDKNGNILKYIKNAAAIYKQKEKHYF